MGLAQFERFADAFGLAGRDVLPVVRDVQPVIAAIHGSEYLTGPNAAQPFFLVGGSSTSVAGQSPAFRVEAGDVDAWVWVNLPTAPGTPMVLELGTAATALFGPTALPKQEFNVTPSRRVVNRGTLLAAGDAANRPGLTTLGDSTYIGPFFIQKNAALVVRGTVLGAFTTVCNFMVLEHPRSDPT